MLGALIFWIIVGLIAGAWPSWSCQEMIRGE
jgi:hypothetical protein